MASAWGQHLQQVVGVPVSSSRGTGGGQKLSPVDGGSIHKLLRALPGRNVGHGSQALMRGGIFLCVPVSPVEAACSGPLSDGKAEVRLVLLAQDALHRAVVRHPSVCFLFVWCPKRPLYLQGTMSSHLGWQVVVSRPR